MRQHDAIPIHEVLREFPGKWVAIKDGVVVDARETPDLLVMSLHERDIVDATIMRAPAEHEPEIVGLG